MWEAFSEYGLLGLVLVSVGGYCGWLIRDLMKAYHDHVQHDTERYIEILEKNSDAINHFSKAMELNTRIQQQILEMVMDLRGGKLNDR